jgi:hypothetical protein
MDDDVISVIEPSDAPDRSVTRRLSPLIARSLRSCHEPAA